jgi:hypothetical protein
MFISNLCKVFLLNYNDVIIKAISQIIEKEKKKYSIKKKNNIIFFLDLIFTSFSLYYIGLRLVFKNSKPFDETKNVKTKCFGVDMRNLDNVFSMSRSQQEFGK